jgi:hypothetical protein
MKTFVSHDGEQARFAGVVDDFIAWSLKHPAAVKHAAGYGQDVVAFTRTRDGAVLWSAFPRRNDGAKLELLPGKSAAMDDALRQEVLEVMQPFSETPLEAKSKLLAPFLKLKRSETRQKVKALLERLIAS